jgi:hypothetical protein
MTSNNNSTDRDEFVADSTVARELDTTTMTIWRHDNNPEMAALGWPVKIQINRRNFRSRNQLEIFKRNLLKRAMVERKKLFADSDAA